MRDGLKPPCSTVVTSHLGPDPLGCKGPKLGACAGIGTGIFRSADAHDSGRFRIKEEISSDQILSDAREWEKVMLPGLRPQAGFWGRVKARRGAGGPEMLIPSSCCQSGRFSKEV